MHTLARNRQKLYYALYEGEEKKLDADGRYTGEKLLTYSGAFEARLNISPALGYADIENFGLNTDYSHILVTDDMECEIDEKTIIWYGKEPTEYFNYVVLRKAVTLNHVIYALQQVNGDISRPYAYKLFTNRMEWVHDETEQGYMIYDV